MSHKATREGDEWVCHKCTKRWGVDEDEPKCVEAKPSLHRLAQLNRTRRSHGLK